MSEKEIRDLAEHSAHATLAEETPEQLDELTALALTISNIEVAMLLAAISQPTEAVNA